VGGGFSIASVCAIDTCAEPDELHFDSLCDCGNIRALLGCNGSAEAELDMGEVTMTADVDSLSDSQLYVLQRRIPGKYLKIVPWALLLGASETALFSCR